MATKAQLEAQVNRLQLELSEVRQQLSDVYQKLEDRLATKPEKEVDRLSGELDAERDTRKEAVEVALEALSSVSDALIKTATGQDYFHRIFGYMRLEDIEEFIVADALDQLKSYEV